MPFVVDLQCTCGHVRTVYLRSSKAAPDPEDTLCPECNSASFIRCVGGCFAAFASSNLETRSQILKKRSEEHSKRTFKDNYERFRAKTMGK